MMGKFLIKKLLVILFLFILLSNFQVSAAPNSSLYFVPNNINIAPNQTFTLDSTINPGTNQVTAVEVHLVFNPSILKLNSIAPSNVFSQVLQTAQIDNNSGKATMTIGVPPGKPATGIVKVASFSFSTLNSIGPTLINYESNTIASALYESNNVLKSLNHASVNIIGPTTVAKLPTIPNGTCGKYSPSTKTTPITFTWSSGTGLQIWDSTGYWWYNDKASTPFTITSKDNLGFIYAVPSGRTVYARTTFTWHKFSTKDKITCSLY